MDYEEKLRDKIALAAMCTIIQKLPFEALSGCIAEEKFAATAAGAYGYVDAMMTERKLR
jgi:hypothetical protein